MMEQKWAHTKNVLRPFVRVVRDGYSVVLVLVYHHIDEAPGNGRFPFLSRVSPSQFRWQINLLRRLGRFVSLEEIREARNLATINFAITFDGVSSSILSVTPFLESQAIPYAVCASTETTENGQGLIDQILAIEEHIPPADIRQCVLSHFRFDGSEGVNHFSLSDFYRNSEVDPLAFETCVVDPLFSRVARNGGSFGRTYLSWEEIEKQFVQSPHATIVNHSARRVRMDRLSHLALQKDVVSSIEKFNNALGFTPEYYAIPFGRVSQNLALDLMDVLYDHACKGILWTNGGGNLIKNPYRTQMIHLSRVPAPPTATGLLKLLIEGFVDGHPAIVDHIRPVTRQGHYEIISSENARPALLFDNLMRQGKDYSSDPSFYDYYFRQNPYKRALPDYFAVVASGRLEATIYNLHHRFSLGSQSVKGSYFCSWRKLPVSHKHASAQMLLSALKTEPIVGGSSTNPLSTRALRSWKRIPVNVHRIKVTGRSKLEVPPQGYTIKQFGEYPDSIDMLAAQANERFDFSIERSATFYRWRFDRYPLARSAYFVLFKNGDPCAYFVTLCKDDVLSISDFFCSTPDDFAHLFHYISVYCFVKAISTIYVETSLASISAFLEDRCRSKPEQIFHYYFFNPSFSEIADCWDKIENDWENLQFHETRACGDVLLK